MKKNLASQVVRDGQIAVGHEASHFEVWRITSVSLQKMKILRINSYNAATKTG